MLETIKNAFAGIKTCSPEHATRARKLLVKLADSDLRQLSAARVEILGKIAFNILRSRGFAFDLLVDEMLENNVGGRVAPSFDN
jgi:hypothetical protein